jgi:preprotein translocase SecE subunit
MADKKKNASQSEIVEPKVRKEPGSEKKSASQSEIAEPKVRKEPGSEKKSAQATSREREERRARDNHNRPVKRETKQPSGLRKRLRKNRAISFLIEAYAELRYKVTWPTFQEARNMTIVVIVLSAVIAAILAVADIGLLGLFRLISGS